MTPNSRFVDLARRRDTRPHEGSRGTVHATVAKTGRGRGVAVRDRTGSWDDLPGGHLGR